MAMKFFQSNFENASPQALAKTEERTEIKQNEFLEFMTKDLCLTKGSLDTSGGVTKVKLTNNVNLIGQGEPKYYKGTDENGNLFVECEWSNKFKLNGKEIDDPPNIDRITFDGKQRTYTIKTYAVNDDGSTLITFGDKNKKQVADNPNEALTLFVYQPNEISGNLNLISYTIGDRKIK